MSDAETTQAEQTAPADQEAPEAAVDTETVRTADDAAQEEGYASAYSKQSVLADLAKEREARKGLEAQLKEIEDAKLSELERAQRDAQEVREQLAALRVENTRYQVVQAKGVPAELAEFITGDTEEEMAAKADMLLARIPSSPTTPKPDRTQGASSGNARPMSNAELFAQQTAGF